MTRILRLLMIAAVAWPLWQPAAAQKKAVPPKQKTETVVKADKAKIAECQESDAERLTLDQRKPAKMAVKCGISPKAYRGIKTKDVCDGTETNKYIPVYGWWYDISGNTSQMIYPADELNLRDGDVIKGITFHTNSSGIKISGGEITVTIALTDASTLSSLATLTGTTAVATVEPTNGATTLSVTFNDGLEYDGQKNLIVQTVNSTPGEEDSSNDNSCTWWLGQTTATYTSYHNKGSDSQQKFLPKMTLTYDATVVEPYAASLRGNGAFGDVTKGASKNATFTLRNEGENAFIPILTSSDPAFTITGDMTSQLAADQVRLFTVTFNPSRVQEYTGTLSLSANESENITASIPLSGSGTNSVTVADGEGENGFVPIYTYYLENATNHGQIIYPATMLGNLIEKPIKSITFYATGPLKATSSSTTGTQTKVALKLGETTSASYPNSSPTFFEDEDGLTTVSTLSTILTGDNYVTFTLDNPYTYNGGNLIVDASTIENGSYYVTSSTQWKGVSQNYASIHKYGSNNISQQNFLPKITFEFEAGVTIDKNSLDFGNVEVNTTSAAQTVVVKNNSDEAVNLSCSFDNPKFGTTSTATSVPVGGQVEIPVTFTPDAVGEQTGTMTIDTDEQTFNVTLNGNAVAAYAATLEPQTVDFGSVVVSGSETATVILTNTGANAITPTFTQPEAPFSVTGETGALASGETRTYTITFAPTAEDTYSGEFTIADADHSISFTVTLTGQGAPIQPITASPTTLDFGNQAVNSTSSYKTVTFTNPNNTPLTVSLNATAPYTITSPTSAQVTINGNGSQTVRVTFTPADARNYNGTLTASVNGVNTVVALKGVGTISGTPAAIRDSSFFAGITYKWPITTEANTSTLDKVATDPDQIIAMVREIYTNRDIPGSYKRGYSSTGGSEDYDDVYYGGVGTITRSSSGYNSSSYYSYTNKYGWNIPGNIVYNTYSYFDGDATAYFAHMNSTQYKPYQEGLTMLLVEVNDTIQNVTFDSSITDPYQKLKEYISKTIKSVRVVTQAKRTGTGDQAGTLFNIECDKMNKFYLMAKGQMRWYDNSDRAPFVYNGTTYKFGEHVCDEPCYLYSRYNYTTVMDQYNDNFVREPFYHMFEQFSPTTSNVSDQSHDLYASLVRMESFPVIHDCMSVAPVMGHQFQMYGVQSGAADCQDVRDLMFFVPDKRMQYYCIQGTDTTYCRDEYYNGERDVTQKFRNYNINIPPKMGLYVIHQDTVQALERNQDYFRLKLTWDSNMDEFLPSDQQEYQLYEVFTDEFGASKWIPVYERNAQGLYKNATTGEWQADTTGAVAVVLHFAPGADKVYNYVYELRGDASREVTYAIRGQDVGHFLSLQMSNEQSYVIPGKDPAEMVLMASPTVYSRYEAQNENNCYSNKIQMKAAPQTIKASYLPDGSTITLNRSYSKLEDGETVTVTEPIATLTINTSTKKFTVSGSVLNDVESLFPKGTQDGKTAGYHANNFTNNQISYTTQTISGTEYINFNLAIWDNFVVNVSKNEHPGLYTYQLRFNTAESFVGLNGSTNEAYSQPIRVYVYKTDSKVNSYTQTQVDDDATGALEVSKDIEFSAQVMLSSKGEILRYDAYRWNAGAPRSIVLEGGDTDEDEEDADPDGIAGNQGDSYSITMNAIGTSDYYVGDAVAVSTTNPQNWAKFVDYYPKTQPEAQAFVYAPVVELFTKGYQEGSTDKQRGDYNTYGGPLKVGTTGKLHVQVVTPMAEYNPLMSSYSWKDENNNKYAYYNIKLKMDIKKVPQGYEFYKIRAWRILDEGLQGEEYDELKNTQSPNCRVGEKVLFEDITYPDCDAGSNYAYNLGSDDKNVTVEGADGQSHTYTSYTGTFGARKLRTEGANEQGVIDELPVTFVVRIYYTKSENLTNSQSVIGSKADGDVVTNPDAEFYAVDYTFTEIFTSEEDVPTAIQSIDASEVVSMKYYNVAGIESDTPFKGVNIVVTRYSDGSTTTTKILK